MLFFWNFTTGTHVPGPTPTVESFKSKHMLRGAVTRNLAAVVLSAAAVAGTASPTSVPVQAPSSTPTPSDLFVLSLNMEVQATGDCPSPSPLRVYDCAYFVLDEIAQALGLAAPFLPDLGGFTSFSLANKAALVPSVLNDDTLSPTTAWKVMGNISAQLRDLGRVRDVDGWAESVEATLLSQAFRSGLSSRTGGYTDFAVVSSCRATPLFGRAQPSPMPSISAAPSTYFPTATNQVPTNTRGGLLAFFDSHPCLAPIF